MAALKRNAQPAPPRFTLHRVASLATGLLTLILLYMMFFVYSPIPPVILMAVVGALATVLGLRGVRWAPMNLLPFALAVPLVAGVTVGLRRNWT